MEEIYSSQGTPSYPWALEASSRRSASRVEERKEKQLPVFDRSACCSNKPIDFFIWHAFRSSLCSSLLMDADLQAMVDAGKLDAKAAAALDKLKPNTFCLHKSWGFEPFPESDRS
jgi:hypothetical protein